MMAQHATCKLVTVADSKYLTLAKAMIRSAAVHFPSASVYIELVNVSEDEVSAFLKQFPDVAVQVTNILFANQNQKKCYCTNSRGKLLNKLRKEYGNTILIWVDADILFRKSCDELKKLMEENDLVANRKPNGGMIRAAFFSIGTSPAANAFLAEYSKVVQTQNQWERVTGNTLKQLQSPTNWFIWMVNQRQLTDVYDKFYQDRMHFLNLDTKYCDVKLSEDSVVWNGLSKNKDKTVWQAEVTKYYGGIE